MIGVRSFGTDAERVARHGGVSTGLQRAGVSACAKHFPGHGDTERTRTSSCPSARRLSGPPAAVRRRGRRRRPRRVMTAHVRVPSLGEIPATVNPALIAGLLRDEFGFEGLVIADALEMQGVAAPSVWRRRRARARGGRRRLAPRARPRRGRAVDAVQAALVAAVASGRLTEERLSEAARRLERLGTFAAAGAGAGRAAGPSPRAGPCGPPAPSRCPRAPSWSKSSCRPPTSPPARTRTAWVTHCGGGCRIPR